MSNETENIFSRYLKRSENIKYSLLNKDVAMSHSEKMHVFYDFIKANFGYNVEKVSVLDVGFGFGDNLLELIRIGFKPENLSGIELMPDRFEIAKSRLPSSVCIALGDASTEFEDVKQYDLVLFFLVYSSILDDAYQEKIAQKYWDKVREGGGILLYDFTFNNPKNKDVRGVTIGRIKKLFPCSNLAVKKITLAPPIARRVVDIFPFLYHFFNFFPCFRTHVMCFIKK